MKKIVLLTLLALCLPRAAIPQTAIGFELNTEGFISLIGQSGTGSVCMTASCAMTTPNLGTPSAINLANATNFPTTGVTPGSYLSANITVNSNGAITSASNGGSVNLYQIICSNGLTSPATYTGTTAETNLENCSIPANSAIAGSLLRITVNWYRSATATDTVSFRVRMCAASACTSGGLFIIDATDASSGSVQYYTGANVYVTGSATESIFTIGLPSGSSSTFAPTTGTQDMTAAQYLAFNCTNVTSSADTCGIYAWTVELLL